MTVYGKTWGQSYSEQSGLIAHALDGWTRQRVSLPTLQWEDRPRFDIGPMVWDDVDLTGTGSATFDAARSSVTVAATGGVRVRQSWERIICAGGSQVAMVDARIGRPGAARATRVGLMDGETGVYFEANESGYAVGTRNSGADTSVLSGHLNGSSDLQMDGDHIQTFVFESVWPGWARVSILDGAVMRTLHEFRGTTAPVFSRAALPIRIEAEGTGSVEYFGARVFAEVPAIEQARTLFVPLAGNAVAMRCASPSSAVTVGRIALDSGQLWRAIVNPTLASAPEWRTVPGSALEWCEVEPLGRRPTGTVVAESTSYHSLSWRALGFSAAGLSEIVVVDAGDLAEGELSVAWSEQ